MYWSAMGQEVKQRVSTTGREELLVGLTMNLLISEAPD